MVSTLKSIGPGGATDMPTQKLTPEFINAAIEGFESQKRRIDAQLSELKQLLRGDSTGAAVVSKAPRHARKISAAGRRKIASAQRARWAKVRGERESAASETPKRKGRLSAAGRKAISEATKRRWALKRADAEKGQAVAVKRASTKRGPMKVAKKAGASTKG